MTLGPHPKSAGNFLLLIIHQRFLEIVSSSALQMLEQVLAALI